MSAEIHRMIARAIGHDDFTVVNDERVVDERSGVSRTLGELGLFRAADAIREASREVAARQRRSQLLARHVDQYVSNPFRWDDLPEARKAAILAYRRALLDLPQSPDWPDAAFPSAPQ